MITGSSRRKKLALVLTVVASLLERGRSEARDPDLSPSEIQQIQGEVQQLERLLPKAVDPAEITYILAADNSRLGNKAAMLGWLKKLEAMNSGYDIHGDLNLRRFASDPEVQRIAQRMHARVPEVHRSELAFQLAEKDLIPEGVAFDPITHDLYLSSINKRKIVRINPSGEFHDFISTGQDGIGETLGMKVEPKSHTLWVCSALEYGPSVGWSGVFHYDLASGKLIKKYTVEPKPQQHLFNDLAISSAGDIYLTDSSAGLVYQILHDRDLLEPIQEMPKLGYPNGIAISHDDKKLYIAHFNGGVTLFDLVSRKAKLLPHPESVTLAEIDGLYFVRNTLIGIQNGIGAARVSRFFLNASGDRVERAEILEDHSPYMEIPTTGAPAGDEFYFSGSSQGNLWHDGKITDPAKLKPAYILRMKL